MPRKKVTPPPSVDHVPAILVALAYLIGFVTSYIAFELNDRTYVPHTLDQAPVTQQAVVYEAVRTVTTDEGFFVTENGQERIISAAQLEGELTPGYHRAIAASSVSPDGEFVYYCAVMDRADSCLPFVYSRSEDVVHSVSDVNGRMEIGLVSAREASWNANGSLTIDGRVSIDTARPWELQ